MRALTLTLWFTALALASPAPGAPKPAKPSGADEVPEFTPAADSPVAEPAKEGQQEAPEVSLEDSFRALQSKIQLRTTKRSQSLEDVPMTLSWIPQEEFEGTGGFSLCDAIQYFPGLECRRGAMRQAVVSARGLGANFLSNRILLLRDGRPETDPWTGIFYPDETTPLVNLKQIEVVRGPGSSLYGSNAFGGVINLITRTPSELIPEGKSVGYEARVAAGQHNTLRIQGTAAARLGPVDGMVSYHGFDSDGPQLFSEPMQGRVDTNQWSKIHHVSGKVTTGPVRFDAAYTNAAIGRPGGTELATIGNCGRCHYSPRDSEHSEVFTVGANARVEPTEAITLFADAFAYFKRRVVDLENGITREDQRSLGKRRRLAAEAGAELKLGWFNLTVGGDAKQDISNNENLLPGITNLVDTTGLVFGGFADGEVRPHRALVIGGGVRYDAYRYSTNLWRNQTDHVSPRASIVFHALPQLTLRGNYGHAFRAPTMSELGISAQMFASTLLGNPYLRPETLDAVEAAVDFWPAGDAVRVTATGFGGIARNFINEVLVGSTSAQFTNVGDARVVGVEVEGSARLPRLNAGFDFAYSLLNARMISGHEAGQPLDYAPQHRFSLRGRARPTKEMFVEIYGLFVGDRRDPGHETDAAGNPIGNVQLSPYFVANARMGWDLSSEVTVALIATNLFNSQYQEMYGFPAPSTQVFVELELRQ